MYRILISACFLVSLLIVHSSLSACPKLLDFLILAIPQVAILFGCAGLASMMRESRWATFGLVLPILFVLLLGEKTVQYYCASLTSADPMSGYGLPIIVFWSWMVQVVVIAVVAGSLTVVRQSELSAKRGSIRFLCTSLIALPPAWICLLMSAESILRSPN